VSNITKGPLLLKLFFIFVKGVSNITKVILFVMLIVFLAEFENAWFYS
jgi:hypothetical protein